MARGKKSERNTSITDAAAAKHVSTAADRAIMTCTDVPGFHLIKLAKGGAWRYRYTDTTGKRRAVTIGKYPLLTPDAAAQEVRKWIKDEADPLRDKQEKAAQRLTATQIAERRVMRAYLEGGYADHMAAWGYRAAKDASNRLHKHFDHLMTSDMAQIKKADIDEWVREARKSVTHTTIVRVLGILQTMLNQAVRDEVLESNPLTDYELPAKRQEEVEREASDPGKAKRRAMSDDEQAAILRGLELLAEETRAQRRNSRAHGKPDLPDFDNMPHPHWFIPFCLLALHTGLAPSDLYPLTWEQLNVHFGMIQKPRHKTLHLMRRGSAQPAQLNIRMNTEIQQVMKDWHRDHLAAIGTKDGKGLVFPSARGARQRDSKSHLPHWERVKALGGVTDDLDFYGLRHNFISRLVMAGVPLLVVAKLVGHKSAAMIERHYHHLCPNQAEQAMNIVAAQIKASTHKQGAAHG